MKVVRCKDAGVNCDFVARGNTVEEVLKQCQEHAKKDHGMQTIPPEMLAKVKTIIRDEP